MARAKPERIGKSYKRRASKAGIVSTGFKRNGCRWRMATTLAPSLDAVALCDHISDVIMAETWHAIGEGRQADGLGVQPPLKAFGKQGREAAEGRRPDIRGFTGRPNYPFRDNITRSPIKVKSKALNRSRVKRQRFGENGFIVNETVQGTRATCTITPDRKHAAFVAREFGRGVKYFYVKGMVADTVDRALAAWIGVAIEGALKKADQRERRARKAKTL